MFEQQLLPPVPPSNKEVAKEETVVQLVVKQTTVKKEPSKLSSPLVVELKQPSKQLLLELTPEAKLVQLWKELVLLFALETGIAIANTKNVPSKLSSPLVVELKQPSKQLLLELTPEAKLVQLWKELVLLFALEVKEAVALLVVEAAIVKKELSKLLLMLDAEMEQLSTRLLADSTLQEMLVMQSLPPVQPFKDLGVEAARVHLDEVNVKSLINNSFSIFSYTKYLKTPML